MSAAIVNRVLVVLAAIGLFITSSLTIAHATSTVVPCGAGSACDALWARSESKFLGIPLAHYGLAGYLVLFALAGARSLAWKRFGPLASKLGLAVSGFGFAVSVYLVLTLLTKLHMNCQWCFGSAITMTLTFIGHLVLVKCKAPESEPSMLDALLVPFSLVASMGIAAVMLDGQPKLDPYRNAKVEVLTYERLVPAESYFDGKSTARVTMVEIADFYCPACRSMSKVVRSIKDTYKDNINLAYRSLPLFNTPGHENSLAAALASEYARSKGKYWDFIHAMFTDGAEDAIRSDISLAELLDRLGMNGDEWKSTYQDTKSSMFNDVDQGMKLFEEADIHTTPTFVIFIDKKDPVVVDQQRMAAVLQASPYRELLEGKSQ